MKKENILCNAFSLQMMDLSVASTVQIEPIGIADIPTDFVSAVGHPDTAEVLSNMLGKSVPANRINVQLDKSTVLYVAQLTGGRLPEGSTTLPEGFSFSFLKVTLG